MAEPHRSRMLRFDEEPELGDLLDDPVAVVLMARDRITREDVLRVVAAMRARLAPAGA